MPNSADQLLARALAPCVRFMAEDECSDIPGMLETVSEALIRLDRHLAAGNALPARWAR